MNVYENSATNYFNEVNIFWLHLASPQFGIADHPANKKGRRKIKGKYAYGVMAERCWHLGSIGVSRGDQLSSLSTTCRTVAPKNKGSKRLNRASLQACDPMGTSISVKPLNCTLMREIHTFRLINA